MTMVILLHRHYDSSDLEEVRTQMAALGSPTIRAIEVACYCVAIEGCHRLRAAKADGVPVRIEMLDEDGEIDLDTLDLDTLNWFGDERSIPVLDFVEWLTHGSWPVGAATVEVEEA
jgi:hypothetical protein